MKLQKLDLGFTADKSLMAVQSVNGGEGINFVVHPTYTCTTLLLIAAFSKGSWWTLAYNWDQLRSLATILRLSFVVELPDGRIRRRHVDISGKVAVDTERDIIEGPGIPLTIRPRASGGEEPTQEVPAVES